MRVLLDHCVPRQFGRLLVGHVVRSASEMGWSQLRNGELIASASQEFDVLITVDRSPAFQQNVADLPLAVIAMGAPSNRLRDLAPLVASVLAVLAAPPRRRVYRISHP